MAVTTHGFDDIPEGPNVFVANHACMRDIFAIPASLPEDCDVVISSRLAYKNSSVDTAVRRLVIENALHTIPLEVHGGKEYLKTGLEMARRALLDGHSLLIFPEGAYTGDAQVTKGRTGASRILFDANIGGVEPNLLPIGIRYEPWPTDLDAYMPQDEQIRVTLGDPIDYTAAYRDYAASTDRESRRQALRAPIDMAMRAIAEATNLPYIDEPIELWPRKTMILESGEEVPIPNR
jgi:AMP-dependent synthetase/ligase